MLTLAQKRTRAYLNKIAIACVFCIYIIVHLLFHLEDEKQELLQNLQESCLHLQVSVNAIASTPRYVGMSVNRYIARTVGSIEKQTIASLLFSVDMIKEVLFFVLLRYQKTMQCLVTLTTSAGINAISQNTKVIADFTNQRLGELRGTISSSVKGLNDQIGVLNDAISKIPFMGDKTIPLPIRIPGVDDSSSWNLPSQPLESLSGIKSPTLEEIHSSIRNLVSVPFEELKTTMRAQMNITIPRLELELPTQVSNITFCDNFTPNDAIDTIFDHIRKGLYWGLAMVCVVFLLSVIVEAVRIGWAHNSLKKVGTTVKNQIDTDLFSKMDTNSTEVSENVVKRVEFPILAWFMEKTGWNNGYFEWYCMYISHEIAWTCIVVGGVGFLLIQCQIWIIQFTFRAVTPAFVALLSHSVDQITTKVNEYSKLAIETYVGALNQQIGIMETQIQKEVDRIIQQFTSIIDKSVFSIFQGFQETIESVVKAVPVIGEAITSYFKCMLGDTITSTFSKLSIRPEIPRLEIGDFEINVSKMVDLLNLSGAMGKLSKGQEQLFMNQIETFKEHYVKQLVGPWYHSIGASQAANQEAVQAVTADGQPYDGLRTSFMSMLQ